MNMSINMKTNYQIVTKIRVTAILMIMVALLSSYSFNKNEMRSKFKYEGTYSLFIESINGLTFNWITEERDSGYFELITENNILIEKGTTSTGKVHIFRSELELRDVVYFKFGNQLSKHKIKLRPPNKEPLSNYSNVDSMYVVGDVHGRYDELINLLQKSAIIDDDLNWLGGKAHIVFLGDLFDRGNDVTKVLWFIYQLEDKAEEVGGKVHVVLGNHEIMTMSKDLRYVGSKENALASTYGVKYDEMFHPTKSLLGKWLASKPTVIKIDNAIFAHGGIIDLNTKSINEFNGWVQAYMQEPVFLDIMSNDPDTSLYTRELWDKRYAFFYSPYSPFWYRGYVQSDTLQVQLNTMLRKYKSKIHVVAHTPLKTITERYNGKLLTTDLYEAATQLLFLERKGKKYIRYKIDSDGVQSQITN